MQAVAIYDYSQRNHDGAWLLVQIGVALRERGAVKRDSFSMVMPAAAGAARHAGAVSRGLPEDHQASPERAHLPARRDQLLSEERRRRIHPVVRAAGRGTVRDPAIVPSEHGVVIGELYFKSPTLRWDDGTYRLVFDNDKGHAELPIRLE